MTDEDAKSEDSQRNRELAALLVHDFKSPLSAIVASLGYLESTVASAGEDVRAALHDAQLAGQLLLCFVENQDFIARVEAGERLAPAEIALAPFLTGLVRRLTPLAGSYGVGLEVREPPVDRVLLVEAETLLIVMRNLILSALQHQPAGATVTVAGTVGDDELRLQVLDDGAPIAAELVASILSRSGQALTRQAGAGRYARGLGLYAASLGAGHLGGRIEVGRDGGRVSFTLCLPGVA